MNGLEEEKNITTQTNEEKQTSEAKQVSEAKQAKPQAKAKKKDNDKDTFADYKAEFKKIVWPTRVEVVKKTATVIVTSFLIGVIIFCMDTVFTAGYSAIIGLLG